MKYFQTLIVFLTLVITVNGQIIVTEPGIPVNSEAVKIIFDATMGTAGLEGFSGDVYAHTGVITDKSSSGSDWKYVKTNWGQNTEETKLTRIGTDLYELEIGPSIQAYYGVPSSETILQMAFVFRSADTSKEGKDDGGKDIFVEVFSDGFFVKIDQPSNNKIIEAGNSINIVVSSTQADDIELGINADIVAQTIGNMLTFENQFDEPGDYSLIAYGDNGSELDEDTVFVCVREDVVEETMPSGLKRGVNHLSDNSVILVLWAPFKEYVFALGNFNDWQPRNEYQMKKDGDYFWLELNNLWPDYPYIYQYLVDGTLLLADPYTDQVSDPFNDKYISEQTYPNLVEYPFQSTNGLAASFTTGETPYEWEINDFTPVEKEKLVIYELLIRDFDERHSYRSVTDRLDYLQALGINALELMPINEFEGNSSWGYNPSFFFAPDKYYGPKNELKRLIDECHKRGIAVIIDMVLNHSYSQSPFLQMYLEGGKPAANNPWYNENHNFTNPDAQWGYDFNHESIHMQELVDSINSYWMTEYKVDGFRFDFTKGFGNNVKGSSDSWGSNYDSDRIRLLKRMTDAIWERNPDALVIFEHLAENSEEKELANHGILLWGNMNHEYSEAAMGYNSNFNWGVYKNRGWSEPNLVSYMESHDEERMMYKMAQYGNSSGDYSTRDHVQGAHRIGLNSLFFLPVPGPKMIWMFGELGYDVSINDPCRVCEKPILWNYYDEWQRKNIYNIMSNLNYLKNTYEIFSTDDFVMWLSGDVKQYRLVQGDDFVVAVGNFDVTKRSTTVSFPTTGTWYEYFSKTIMEISDQSHSMTLEPGEYKLFSTTEFDWNTDMSPVNTEDKPIFREQFMVFPNPSQNEVSWSGNFDLIELYDVSGKLIKKMSGSNSMNVSKLKKGMYILLARNDDGFLFYSKMVKE